MRKIFFLLFLFFIILSTQSLEAMDTKFVLFVMDGVDIFELQGVETPNLDSLVSKGSIALMNTRTAGGLSSKDAYLTIGSGDRALAHNSASLSFNKGEEYLGIDSYQVYLSRVAKGEVEGEILNLEIASLLRLNQSSHYRANVGKLGHSLKDSGLRTTVLGNADFLEEQNRAIALIGMDKDGVVYQGDVGGRMSLSSRQHPSLYVTNKSYLLERYREYLPKSDFIIIESGDTSRVESIANLVVKDRFTEEKAGAIKRVDNLLGEVSRELDFNKDYIMILTPTVSREGISKGNRLGLLTLVGPGIESGLLISPTTRRAGIVSNLDIAPTVYNYLSEDYSYNFAKKEVESLESDRDLGYLQGLNSLINRTFSLRPKVIKGFVFLQIIILVVVGVMILYCDLLPSVIKESIGYLSLSILWVPLLLLISKLYILNNIFFIGVVIVGSSLFLSYLTRRMVEGSLARILIPSIIISIALIVDIILGANLIKTSILGYSPVIGARFYGIGNEFMGILIGAVIISITGLKDMVDINLKIISFLLITAIIVIGHPNLGANFGGLITSASSFLLIYFWLKGYKLNLILFLKFFTIIFIFIGSIVLLDIMNIDGAQSHIGRAFAGVRRGGLEQILLIIYRKVSINIKLLRWTIWSKVLIAFIAILLIMLKNPKGVFESILRDYPFLGIGFKVSIIVSLVTMIVNDSGVVAAATLLFVPVFTLIYLVVEKISILKEE